MWAERSNCSDFIYLYESLLAVADPNPNWCCQEFKIWPNERSATVHNVHMLLVFYVWTAAGKWGKWSNELWS